MASPAAIIDARVKAQGFRLIAIGIALGQQLSDFKSGFGSTLLNYQLVLRLVIEPECSRHAQWQRFRILDMSLPANDAVQAPKLRSFATIDAQAVTLSRLHVFLPLLRHAGEMLTAMGVAYRKLRRTSKVCTTAVREFLILMPPGRGML